MLGKKKYEKRLDSSKVFIGEFHIQTLHSLTMAAASSTTRIHWIHSYFCYGFNWKIFISVFISKHVIKTPMFYRGRAFTQTNKKLCLACSDYDSTYISITKSKSRMETRQRKTSQSNRLSDSYSKFINRISLKDKW